MSSSSSSQTDPEVQPIPRGRLDAPDSEMGGILRLMSAQLDNAIEQYGPGDSRHVREDPPVRHQAAANMET